MDINLFQILLGIGFALVSYLLAQKDARQAEDIKLLFKKHDADVAELQELRNKIASNHYERTELDRKFDRLDATIKEGFVSLGKDMKELTQVMTTHLINHSKE